MDFSRFSLYLFHFFQMSLILRHFSLLEQKKRVPPSNPGPGGRSIQNPFIQVLSEHDVLELAGSEVQCDKLLLGFSSSSSFDLQRLDLGPGVSDDRWLLAKESCLTKGGGYISPPKHWGAKMNPFLTNDFSVGLVETTNYLRLRCQAALSSMRPGFYMLFIIDFIKDSVVSKRCLLVHVYIS